VLEWLTPSFLYTLLKDAAGRLRANRNKLSAAERMQLRDKWRPLFAEELRRRRAEKLRQDVIIHDVARPKTYPGDADDGRISSWFKVALVGQYHKGIEVGLRIHSLVWEESEQSWRLAALEGESEETVTAYLIGYIPYESIVSVNWDGDEYYGYPHIFCHFEYSGQPYERLAFCERRELSYGQEYFSELEDHDRVRLTSEKFGTAWAWRSSS
jgi:hypothetical protein